MNFHVWFLFSFLLRKNYTEIPVDGKTKERWLELCEQASKEQDPKKLMEQVEEIDRILKEKSAIILLSSLTTSRLLASDKHGIALRAPHFGKAHSLRFIRW